jgi:hypothetical protein
VAGAGDDAQRGKAVHVGSARGFDWGLTAEGFLGFVGGAVGNDDDVFHGGLTFLVGYSA